jgi:hypothetical protein
MVPLRGTMQPVTTGPDPAMTRIFVNRPAQIVQSVLAGVFLVIGLAMLADPANRGSGAVATAFGVYSMIRSQKASSLTLTPSTLRARTMARTRTFPISSLSEVTVVTGQTGLNGFGREHLLIRTRAGVEFRFKELNALPPGPGESNPVRDAARLASELIAEAEDGRSA